METSNSSSNSNSISNSNSNSNSKKVHAILVGLPLQGHVIPFVQLAIKLASKGFSITFINTKHIHHQITSSNASAFDGGEDIFVEARRGSTGLDIEYMTITDGLPLEFDRSLNHDQWVGANIYCLQAHLEVAVCKIVTSRPSIRCCLVADSYFVWASKLASKFGLVHVSFWTEPAVVLDIYFHRHLLKENGHIGLGSSARKDIINYIPGISSLKRTDLTSYLQEEDLTTMHPQYNFASLDDTRKAQFILSNTVQELEAHTISAVQAHVPFYAIGPLFSPEFTKSPVTTSLWAESDCTLWLDSKPPGSVLYVSFGSYAHIGKEELEEIANGIKLSGVNFLWVIRPDMVSSDHVDPLPTGFRDEVRDRGMIVTWTCQKEVLSHHAIGGFLTHCGWNSALESIWCEIPLLCFPLLTDQFTNRKLIVDDWKIGCNLCEERPVTKEEVLIKTKDLISGSLGHELRDRIKGIKKVLQNAMMTEGSSNNNVDSFIKDLNVAFDKKN
ncbi:UDP-glycosyltransferase 86A1 [Beta vulgaris subsp. vulgaris]|uniref:UDP-glycosyltransferase 86A1 n=1 Tax=Beta vulgaris subsp. vulgaris TaxID=3555 RepID=UPI002036B179|nr:UDP-glycosyltransferase 86A1 [Beta vulgaris subsp. vulgaris]